MLPSFQRGDCLSGIVTYFGPVVIRLFRLATAVESSERRKTVPTANPRCAEADDNWLAENRGWLYTCTEQSRSMRNPYCDWPSKSVGSCRMARVGTALPSWGTGED